jgi:hypothetical protein
MNGSPERCVARSKRVIGCVLLGSTVPAGRYFWTGSVSPTSPLVTISAKSKAVKTLVTEPISNTVSPPSRRRPGPSDPAVLTPGFCGFTSPATSPTPAVCADSETRRCSSKASACDQAETFLESLMLAPAIPKREAASPARPAWQARRRLMICVRPIDTTPLPSAFNTRHRSGSPEGPRLDGIRNSTKWSRPGPFGTIPHGK